MMWSVPGKIRDHKIRASVAEIATATVRIMTTGRIELGPTGRTVAANVKRLRERRGLTLRALSAALKEQGRSLSADALNKIENGAGHEGRGIRRVDADDLVALAVVLGVNPSALLLPYTAKGDVELTVGGKVDARTAWKWAQGERPLRVPEGDDGAALVDFQRDARPAGMRMWPITTRAGRVAAVESDRERMDELGGADGAGLD